MFTHCCVPAPVTPPLLLTQQVRVPAEPSRRDRKMLIFCSIEYILQFFPYFDNQKGLLAACYASALVVLPRVLNKLSVRHIASSQRMVIKDFWDSRIKFRKIWRVCRIWNHKVVSQVINRVSGNVEQLPVKWIDDFAQQMEAGVPATWSRFPREYSQTTTSSQFWERRISTCMLPRKPSMLLKYNPPGAELFA